MKTVILFFFMIATTFVFGQKTYEFDYMIQYDFYWDHKTSRPTKYIYLTNSQNNEFTAVLTESDSTNYKLDFLDHKGNHSISTIRKNLFSSSKSLRMKCNDVKPHSNTRRSLAKRFDFLIKEDTIISGDLFGHYILKSRKHDDSAVEHYIIYTSLDQHLPILRYSTAFVKWESTMNLPNGIIFEKYLMNVDGKKRHKLVLKSYAITNKAIIVPEDCDYSK